MALTEFTADVENISALDDQPSLSASQLKMTFDKAAKDIKAYINGTLKTFVDALYRKPVGGIPDTDIASAATWNAKGSYSKPVGGIPKTDMASDVQTSLGKADTALQSVATANIADGAVTSAKLAAQTIIKVSGSAIYGAELPNSGTTGQVFFKKVT